MKDSSLKVPPGMEGVVIDVKIFSRVEDQVVEKDRGERIGEIRRLEGLEKIRVNEVRDGELTELLEGQTGCARSQVPAPSRKRSRRERSSRRLLLADLAPSRASTSRRSALRAGP